MDKSFKYHDKVCENIEFCRIAIPSEKDKILEFKQYMNSDKMWYIIYADIESLIRKIDGRANNPEKSSKMKIGELIPSGYSMPTILVFNHIEDKYTLYRGKDCMKKIVWNFKRARKMYNWFWKEKNVTINKKRFKIIYRYRCMLYLQNKILKKFLWKYKLSKCYRSLSLYR